MKLVVTFLHVLLPELFTSIPAGEIRQAFYSPEPCPEFGAGSRNRPFNRSDEKGTMSKVIFLACDLVF